MDGVAPHSGLVAKNPLLFLNDQRLCMEDLGMLHSHG